MIKEENIKSKINISKIDKIPIDWQEKELGKIFKLTSGKTKPQLILENPKDKSIYPVYGGNRIIGYSSEFNLTGENIIIGRVGEYCGITKYINELCWITDNALYTKEYLLDVNINFLAYKLQHEDLSKLRSKGGQPLISQVPISIHKIILPKSIQEQTAIANLLSTWDKAIQTTNTLIEQKQNRKKWLMQMLLTGKKRLKGFSGKTEFHVLGNYIKEVSERNKENKVQNVLSVTNRRGFINQSEQFDRVVASDDSTNYKIVRKGQFAYNPSRVNVGSLDLLRDCDVGILSPMYVVFETNSKKLNPMFLLYHLKSNWFNGHIPMFVQGSVRDSLSFDGLCGMKFFIPSVQEQTEIAKIIQVSDKEIQLLQNKLDQLKEQKKGLMQILLRGKKRLKVN